MSKSKENYHNNLQYLQKKIKTFEFENENESLDEDELLTIEKDNKRYLMQSAYDNERAAEIWCQQFDKVEYDGVFIIFGLGHIEYIRKLNELYPDNIVVIYEPCESILKKQMMQYDLKDLLEDSKIYIVAGKDRFRLLTDVLFCVVDYANIVKNQYAAIPNYTTIFAEEYDLFKKAVENSLSRELVQKNTDINREMAFGRSFLFNLERFMDEAGMLELKNEFENNHIEDYPAIIISAGPSLDKNIEQVAAIKNKAFIICVNTAIRTVERLNIVPDILVSVDPEYKNPDSIMNGFSKDLPLVTSIHGDYRINRKNYGRKFYNLKGTRFPCGIMKKYDKEVELYQSGGSVSCEAFMIAKILGFKNIIMIGQDLAYPNNQIHAKDAHTDEKAIENIDSGKYFYVDAIDGGKVLTDTSMHHYRKWFEEAIITYDDLNVINATEGGGMIQGATVMTLEEAIAKYCPSKEKDFAAIIQSAPYVFSEEEQKEIKQYILDTRDKMSDFKKEFAKIDNLFADVDMLNRKGKIGTNSFKKKYSEILDFIERTETEDEFELIRMFQKTEEYAVKDMMSAKVGNAYDEVKLFVEGGRTLLDGNIKAVDKLLAAWDEVSE